MREQCDACSAAFRPHHDNLGLGQNDGVRQLLAPGSAAAAFDTLDGDPFAGSRARGEQLIRGQLDKLPWDLIGRAAALGRAAAPSAEQLVDARHYEAQRQLNAGRKRDLGARNHAKKVQARLDERKRRDVDALRGAAGASGASVGLARFARAE